MLNLPESMLRTIGKDRKKIMAAVKVGAGSGSTKVSSGQSNIMVRMEKMLVTWMDHRKRQGVNVTFDDTNNKTMECFNYLKEKEISHVPDFVTSMDWFYKFKMHYGFHSVKLSGEVKSSDEDAAAFVPRSSQGHHRGAPVGCNMNRASLQWKKMPECTYIMREEKVAQNFKTFKNRFTLLLGVNLMGDCKLKPVMVYCVDNLCALKSYDKGRLSVRW